MGKAFYKFSVSLAYNVLDGTKNEHQTFVDREVCKIIGQLPYGTKLVEVEKCLIHSLHLEYAAIFEHPIFIDDSEIKDLTEYKRDIGFRFDDNEDDAKVYTYNKTNNLNFDEFVNKDDK